MTELNISDNKFTDQKELVDEVCGLLKTPDLGLRMLDMKYNEIHDEGISLMMAAINTLEDKRTKLDVTDRFSEKTSAEFNALMKSIKVKKPKKKAASKPAK